MTRVLVLVDGEHYPPVTRWGLEVAAQRGLEPVGVLLVGGGEKLPAGGALDLGDVPVEASADPFGALVEAIERLRPDAVLDLSDEPVLGYRERMHLAALALVRGVAYVGADFRLDPPHRAPPPAVPTLAVIGTGKRTGKTAVGGHVARLAAGAGLRPVVVAMGRGGPAEPQVAEGTIDLERLRELARGGQHASSDYLEDAMTAGVTTVGARRCAGGLAGAPFATNVEEAVRTATGLGAGMLVLEGSGAAIPPIDWDAGVLVAPASLDPEFLVGYLGPYRLLRSDLLFLTMVSGSGSGPESLSTLLSHVRRLVPDIRIAVSDFVPTPLGDVEGKRVFLATTASENGARVQTRTLEARHSVTVVGTTRRLADRAGLAEDLRAAEPFDVLLTELKAASVDVAAELAIERGAEVVFLDNRPATAEGPGDGEVDALLLEAIELAGERARVRGGAG
jgi:cyclic 2,3-diphosphoglycerate synthetase